MICNKKVAKEVAKKECAGLCYPGSMLLLFALLIGVIINSINCSYNWYVIFGISLIIYIGFYAGFIALEGCWSMLVLIALALILLYFIDVYVIDHC